MFNKLIALLGLSAMMGEGINPAEQAARSVLGGTPGHQGARSARTQVFGGTPPGASGRDDPGGVHAKLTYHGGFSARNRAPAPHAGGRAFNEYHRTPLDRMSLEHAASLADPVLAAGADAMMQDYFADAAAQRNAAKARRRRIRAAGGVA